jgi:predicted kinase
MAEILILSGISNAGKSSWAAKTVQENPEKYIICNRDKIRELLYGYTERNVYEYYGRSNFQYLESQVTAMQDNLISFWLKRGKIVIVDATNLNLKYIKDFDKFGFSTEIKYFDITLKEALTRNMSRNRKVDEAIIEKQYGQYINLRANE